jgi:hypothetical protein
MLEVAVYHPPACDMCDMPYSGVAEVVETAPIDDHKNETSRNTRRDEVLVVLVPFDDIQNLDASRLLNLEPSRLRPERLTQTPVSGMYEEITTAYMPRMKNRTEPVASARPR